MVGRILTSEDRGFSSIEMKKRVSISPHERQVEDRSCSTFGIPCSTPVIVEGEGAACRRGELIVGVGLPSNSPVELPDVLVLNRSTSGYVDRDCRGVIGQSMVTQKLVARLTTPGRIVSGREE